MVSSFFTSCFMGLQSIPDEESMERARLIEGPDGANSLHTTTLRKLLYCLTL